MAYEECFDNSLGEDAWDPFCAIEDGLCFAHLTRNGLRGSKKDKFVVGCTPNCTEENYSFTTVDGYLQTIRECCADFLCNDEIHDTDIERVRNRRKCEACRASGSEGCPDLETISCYGNETQCISFVLVHNNSLVPDVSYKGCATPSFCELARTSPYNGYFLGTITQARCCDTLPSPQPLNFEG
ncbi:Hypothetical predicted protein [Podarcis lilfordi]|uniref:UPAR/Ly6 domain-containing protein n=1 Tax=Podarcis lilfordi TaxID=74358 RepID=A0AA35VVV1_9SAUR|nr:Hypothetical predicted protein [Podarcis lilfordi]